MAKSTPSHVRCLAGEQTGLERTHQVPGQVDGLVRDRQQLGVVGHPGNSHISKGFLRLIMKLAQKFVRFLG